VSAGVLLGLLALVPARRADEPSVVKAIERRGGKVRVDEKRAGMPVAEMDLGSTDVSDAGLKELKAFQGLRIHVRPSTCYGVA
jgi:hypothetical protein